MSVVPQGVYEGTGYIPRTTGRRHWRVVPINAGDMLWWVIFWRGKRIGRTASLDSALRMIGTFLKPH